jgi:AcrR family transcriptional regulator
MKKTHANSNKKTSADESGIKRRYNSPLRQQQAAATRERIVAAGAKLVHSYPAWDWTNLTATAVSERAGVSERTVQRHFATERHLRDAVLQRMLEESGITLQDMELDHFADITQRMFAYLSSFAITPAPVSDPSFASMDKYRRDALLNAVARATPKWASHDQETAAALLDIFWNPPTYERLIAAWGLNPERATGALSWLIDLVAAAINGDHRPTLIE